MCGVTLKGNKTNDVNNTNIELLLNRSFTTIVHNQLALLDTGAEINVIEAKTLAKIKKHSRNYRERVSVATSAGNDVVRGVGNVEINIQGTWCKFHVWKKCSYPIIIGQPILERGYLTFSFKDRLCIVEDHFTFNLVDANSRQKVNVITACEVGRRGS